MIRFFTTPKHSYTIRRFLGVIDSRLAASILPVAYSEKVVSEAAPTASYIFSDLERLSPAGLANLSKTWNQLEAAGGNRLLNHPTRAMRRYELLRTLHEAGINEFNVYRLTESRRPRHYPVFIRREDEHNGPASRLLHNESEFGEEVRSIERQGLLRDNLLAVEFCDTIGKDGVIRKYGAACVGGEVMPVHVYFARERIIKFATQSSVTPETVAEELRYIEENPHRNELQRIFAMARIDYGRVDYGFRNGRMQVWEINTNPNWVPRGQQNPLRETIRLRALRWLGDAFAKIDTK